VPYPSHALLVETDDSSQVVPQPAGSQGRKSCLTSGVLERYADKWHYTAFWDDLAVVLTFVVSHGGY
jgi:hypothetical protein